MKIAVAVDSGSISAHFGHAPEFRFFDVNGATVSDAGSAPNPGHDSVSVPRWLAGQGANCVIAGGIGQGAVDILAELGVTVVAGAAGNPAEAVQSYIRGELKPSLAGTHAGHGHEHGAHAHGGDCCGAGHGAGHQHREGHGGCGCGKKGAGFAD